MAAGDTNLTNLVVSGTASIAGAMTQTGALALSSAGFTMSAIARTATSDGLTTGTIASGPMLQFISVTSASANNIIVLPAPTPGTIVVLAVGANGFELRSSDPATIAINGGTGSAAESAISANMCVVAICTSATTWQGFTLTSAGVLAAIQVAAP